MAGRGKNPPASCLEQPQKGELKLYGQELHSQALSEGTTNIGRAFSQKVLGIEEAQHKGHQVLNPSHNVRRLKSLKVSSPHYLSQDDLMLSHPSSLYRSSSMPNMQSLEWTEDLELFITDCESWRNFQISKKKFDKWVPEDYEFRCEETHQNKGRDNFYYTKSWKMENTLQNFTQLLLLPKPCPRGWKTLNRESLHKSKGGERRYLIEIQELFDPDPDTQEEPQLVVLEGAAGIGKSTLARQPCLVEVLGFSKAGRKNYISKYFTEKREAMAAFNLVKSNPVLSTLCVVPWVSWLVCTCLKEQMDQGEDLKLTSRTTTSLCLEYLSQALSGRVQRTHIRRLCSLATEGICQRRTLFSESDFWIQRLGSNVIVTFLKVGILQKQPNSMSYSFGHLCLQEFFAAMSLTFQCNEERHDYLCIYRTMETLKDIYGRRDLFEIPTVRFLFGLLSENGMREMEKIFACRLPLETRLNLQWYILEETLCHKPYSLGFLHCLYEIQDEELLTQVMQNYQETNVRSPKDIVHPVSQRGVEYMVIQTDMELMVATFCIKYCCHVKWLQLNGGGQQRKISKAPRMIL